MATPPWIDQGDGTQLNTRTGQTRPGGVSGGLGGAGGRAGDWIDQGDGTQLNTRTGQTRPGGVSGGLGGAGGRAGDWIDQGDGTQLNTRTGQTRPGGVSGGLGGAGGRAGGQIDVPSGLIRVQMQDGSFQDLGFNDPALDEALQGGAQPIDPLTGQPMRWSEPFGRGQGYVYGDDQLPGNIIAGSDWEPDQLNKMTDLSFEGTLMSAFPRQFEWDPSQITQDPGYQFALSEGEKGVQRGASANLSLLSGKTLKDLERFRTGLASTYSNQAYGRASQDFERDYNIFEGTQAKRFGRLSTLAGLGPGPAVQQLNTAGQNFATGAGNITQNTGAQQADLVTQAGNARAAGEAAGANIWSNFQPLNTFQDLAYLDRYLQ